VQREISCYSCVGNNLHKCQPMEDMVPLAR
jgi:hypothetical protein